MVFDTLRQSKSLMNVTKVFERKKVKRYLTPYVALP